MDELQIGDRIELVEMPNDPNPIAPGTTGTITYVNHMTYAEWSQYGVKWDNGRSLLMVVPPDKYKRLSQEIIE